MATVYLSYEDSEPAHTLKCVCASCLASGSASCCTLTALLGHSHARTHAEHRLVLDGAPITVSAAMDHFAEAYTAKTGCSLQARPAFPPSAAASPRHTRCRRLIYLTPHLSDPSPPPVLAPHTHLAAVGALDRIRPSPRSHLHPSVRPSERQRPLCTRLAYRGARRGRHSGTSAPFGAELFACGAPPHLRQAGLSDRGEPGEAWREFVLLFCGQAPRAL